MRLLALTYGTEGWWFEPTGVYFFSCKDLRIVAHVLTPNWP